MKLRRFGIQTILILSLILLFNTMKGQIKKNNILTYKELLAKIEEAERNDLPQSAISFCQQIEDRAKREKEYGWYYWAKVKRINNKIKFSPDSLVSELEQLEDECDREKDEANRAILNAILANKYREINSRNIFSRETEVEDIGDDKLSPKYINEWTNVQFSKIIKEHSTRAFENLEILHKTKTKDYPQFITISTDSEIFEHDLLHLIYFFLHNAHYDIPGEKITNNIIQFYAEKGNEDAQIIIELQKVLGDNYADEDIIYDDLNEENEGNENRFKSKNDAFKKLIARHPKNNNAIAEVYYRYASFLKDNSKFEESVEVINDAISKFIKETILKPFQSLLNEIQLKGIDIYISSSVCYPKQEIVANIDYKNINNFKLIRYKLKSQYNTYSKIRAVEKNIERGLKIDNYADLEDQMDYALTPGNDYKKRRDVIKFHAPAQKGVYIYEIKIDDDNKENIKWKGKKYFILTISAIDVITTTDNKYLEYIVVERKSGRPISNANVKLYIENNSSNNFEYDLVESSISDSKGRGKFKKEYNNHKRYIFGVEYNNDKYLFNEIRENEYRYYKYYSEGQNETTHKVTLFLDRSIYRPGQTVYFKGIVYSQKKDSVATYNDLKLTATLIDSNDKELSSTELISNDFGSFSGTFQLPTNCLNGGFTIEIKSSKVRSVRKYFSVEEYKRPSFEVTFDDINTKYQLGDTVTISGNAKTYSGIGLSGAKAQITIKEISYYRWLVSGESKKVFDITLDEQGRFSFPLELKATNKKNYIQYHITCAATSTTGERQENCKLLNAGNQPLNITINQDRICKDTTISLIFGLTNSDGQYVQEVINYNLINEKGEVVDKGNVSSNTNIILKKWQNLESGRYTLETNINEEDIDTKTNKHEIIIFSYSDAQPINNTTLWGKEKDGVIYFGTSFSDAIIYKDVTCNGKVISSENISISNENKKFEFKYKEEYGDGAGIQLLLYREGKLYTQKISIEKPQPDKKLNLKWSSFRDKIYSGSHETWKLKIEDSNGKPIEAECLAFMYDQSLESIRPYQEFYLPIRFYRNIYFREFNSHRSNSSLLYYQTLKHIVWNYNSYDQINTDLYLSSPKFFGFGGYRDNNRMLIMSKSSAEKVGGGDAMYVDNFVYKQSGGIIKFGDAFKRYVDNPGNIVRENFAETAFFYPNLKCDKNGEYIIEFTLPQSLTTWNFKSLAHTKQMQWGTLEAKIIANKDFMISPNMPRFIKKGDIANISSLITNLTDNDINTEVVAEIFDPVNEKILGRQIKHIAINKGESTNIDFNFTTDSTIDKNNDGIIIPDNLDIIGVRFIAKNEQFSDGEQHLLPILSNKIKVVESIPISIRGKQSKEFSLSSLFNNQSEKASNKKITLEFSSNPIWYAIESLPTLSEPISTSSIDWINCLYVNAISSYIVENNPKIKTIYSLWQKNNNGDKNSLRSKLETNQELKTILLNETPWVMEANDEKEQFASIARAFDDYRIKSSIDMSIDKIKSLQKADGGWSWFENMQSNRYITEYIITQLIRLNIICGDTISNFVEEEDYDQDIENMIDKGIEFLNSQMVKEYNDIMERKSRYKYKDIGISHAALRHLYILSLNNSDLNDYINSLDNNSKNAINYFLKKVNEKPTMWDMQDKAMVAQILNNSSREKEAILTMQSIKEHLTHTEDMGSFFDFDENPWGWNKQKINAHVAVIEAFNNIIEDSSIVEEMKIWLLKQKQTQGWKSSAHSVEAIYALLMTGKKSLMTDSKVRISIDNKSIDTDGDDGNSKPEAGTGYIKRIFSNIENSPKVVSVTKEDEEIGWGAIYSSFEEDIDCLNENSNGTLHISKELYLKGKEKNKNGYKDILKRIDSNTQLKVGDIVTARFIIRVDRDLDFVQLKEERAGCFEPLSQLSGYQFGGGTWYYSEIKDASTNLFFEYLQKGDYVLEINYSINRKGEYQSGIATLQSAYSPEFSAHSKSIKIKVVD